MNVNFRSKSSFEDWKLNILTLSEVTRSLNDQKKIDENDLHFFPKYVTDIEVKEKNYEKIIQKNLAILELDKETYKKHSSVGDYILEYGKSLLKNGFLVKAGLILSRVCGSENWDNKLPYALLEKD